MLLYRGDAGAFFGPNRAIHLHFLLLDVGYHRRECAVFYDGYTSLGICLLSHEVVIGEEITIDLESTAMLDLIALSLNLLLLLGKHTFV